MKKFAYFLSIVFHPLILLNFGLFSVLKFHPYYFSKFYDEQFYTLSMFIAANTMLMPLLSFILLKRFKYISTYELSNPKERTLPYFMVIFFLSFTVYQLYSFDFLGLPIQFLLASIICLFLNIVINFKFKISSHAIGSGGLTALFAFLTIFEHISLFTPFFVGSLLVSGLVLFARLELKAHQQNQVYLGYLLGFVFVLLIVAV